MPISLSRPGFVCLFLATGLCLIRAENSNGNPTIVWAREPDHPLRTLPNLSRGGDGQDCHSNIELRLQGVQWKGPSMDANLLGYNGMLPGPVMRLKRGEKVTVTLYNDLGQTPEANDGENEFRYPNTTNLHTHGLHLSGMPPEDDMHVDAGPGASLIYHYSIGDDHMPGTHWYHPHFHGSTTMQLGAGAAGPIIVEDPPGYIPDQIANMEEIIMFIQHMGIPNLQTAARISGSDWLASYTVTNATTTNVAPIMINGQYQPVIEMQAGKWYRWRLIMATWDASILFRPQSDDCSLQLLAKDGIYLEKAPRYVQRIVLSPGNRADVAVRCKTPGRFTLLSRRGPADIDFIGPGFYNPGDEIEGVLWAQPLLASVQVIRGNDVEPDLQPFSVRRPCYLTDLTGLSSTQVNDPFPIYFSDPKDGFTINGVSYQGPSSYVLRIPLGTVQEIDLPTAGTHPYHQHVNPFQIVSIDDVIDGPPLAQTVGNWYLPGDWHDTFQHPSASGTAKVRFQADRFGGWMMVHCHFLAHEDQGMVAQFLLTGKEDTVWPYARFLDPTCQAAAGISYRKTTRSQQFFQWHDSR